MARWIRALRRLAATAWTALARSRPAGRAKAARIAFAVGAAVTLAATLVFASIMLIAPRADAGHAYGKVERGDGYLVYTVPEFPVDGQVNGRWSVPEGKKTPDRILVIAYSDLANVLAGKPPANAYREVHFADGAPWPAWGGWSTLPWHGYVELRYLEYEGGPWSGSYTLPYLCDRCDDPRLTVVWTRGTDWVGSAPDAVTHGSWSVAKDGHVTGDAPILWRGIVNEHNFVDWFAVMYGTLATLGGLTAALGLWWAADAVLARRTRRAPPATAPAPTTEDLLRLVDLSERYLRALTGYFVAGGFIVLIAVVVLSYFAVPALLQSAAEHFFDPYYVDIPILLLAPFLGVVSLTLWGLAFQRVRRERRRWRRVDAEFSRFADAVLEP